MPKIKKNKTTISELEKLEDAEKFSEVGKVLAEQADKIVPFTNALDE